MLVKADSEAFQMCDCGSLEGDVQGEGIIQCAISGDLEFCRTSLK